jgi:hypothetical protein
MKEILEKIINQLLDKGESLKKRITEVNNLQEIDALLSDYEKWDEKAKNILDKGIVMRQLYQMFKGPVHLGNINIDKNSFQGKRNRLQDELPKKVNHLNTALNYIKSANNTDLLPLEDEDYKTNFTNSNPINMKKLFISHSSKDNNIIAPFLDLVNMIGVPHDRIFYCSEEGYGLKPGENLFDGLKKELNYEVFALFMLSKNFYESQVCLCEMGAIWIKSHKQIPITIPPMKFDEMEGVFPKTIGLQLNNKGNMDTLKGELEKYFDIPAMGITRWEEKRNEYLEKVNALLSKTK